MRDYDELKRKAEELVKNDPALAYEVSQVIQKNSVKEDVMNQLDQTDHWTDKYELDELSDEELDSILDSIAEEAAYRYAYEKDYDCNLDYWDNLNNLIDESFAKFKSDRDTALKTDEEIER